MADRLVRIEDGRITQLGVRSEDGWVFVQDQTRGEEAPEV